MTGPVGSIGLEIIGIDAPIRATLANLQAVAAKPLTVQINTQAAQSAVTGLTASLVAANTELRIFAVLGGTSFSTLNAGVSTTTANMVGLNTQLNNGVATVGRFTAAWQANAAAARGAAAASAGASGVVGALGGVRGAAGLNGAALAASFVSPTAGLLLMAAQMGPIVAGAAAAALSFKMIADSTEKAAEFQRSMKQIGAISGETTAQMNDYSEWVVKLSTQIPIATGKLSEMSREAVLVGLHGEEGMKNYVTNMAAFAVVTRDAAGNLGETAKVGQEAVKILRSMGQSTEEVNKNFGTMINGLIAVKTTSGLMIPEVTNLLKYWSSQGHSVGLTTEQMLALSSSLIQTGARAQGAGGAMARFFDVAGSAAAQGGAKLNSWAKVIGLSADQTKELLKNDPMEFLRRFVDGANELDHSGTALSQTLGNVGLNSMQVRRTMHELANAMPLVSGNLKILNDAAADQGLSFRKMMDATDNFKDKLTVLGQGFDALKLNMGMTVLPGMTAVLQWALDLSQATLQASNNLAKLSAGKGVDGTQDFSLETWLKNSGLKQSQLTPAELTRARDLLARMQAEDNNRRVGENFANMTPNVFGSRDFMKDSYGTSAADAIGRLGVQLGDIQRLASGRGVTVGPQTPAQAAADPRTGYSSAEEMGKFGFAFIEGLTSGPGAVRGNSKIAAWCADVAAKIQSELGNKVKYSANAGQFRQNALAAGYTQVDSADARPGDLVFYRGKGYGANGSGNHVETVAGQQNGKLMLVGSNTSPTMTSKEFYDPAHATILRAPTSPFADTQAAGSTAVSVKELEERLKTVQDRMTVAGDGASKYAGNLKALQAAALDAAHSQAEGSDDWHKAVQVYGSASSALKGLEKGTKDYVATTKDFNAYGQAALGLIKDQERANKTGDTAAREAARGAITRFQAQGEGQKAVFNAESAAHTQILSNNQEAAANAISLAEKVAQGKITANQTVLTNLREAQSNELASAETAAQKLAVIQKTSAAIYKGELDVAEAARQRAYAAADQEKTPALRKQDRADADAAYNSAKAAASLAQTKAINAAQKSATDESSKNMLAAEKALNEGKGELAKQAAQAVISSYDAQLAAAGDNAQKRLKIEQDLQKQRLQAMNALVAAEAQIEKQKLQHETNDTANAPGVTQATRVQLYQQLAARLAEIDKETNGKQSQNASTVAADLKTATKTVSDSIHTQRDAYHSLAEELRNGSGVLDPAAAQKALEQFNALSAATQKLGIYSDPMVVAARKVTYALIQQGQAAFETSRDLVDITANNEDFASSTVDTANGLEQMGQRQAAISILTSALNDLMDSASRGEATAESVNKLRAALNGLTQAQAVETQAQDFLAGLGGSIDDQLAAITAKLEDPNTSAPLRKAISDMTQDFGGSVTPGSMGEAAAQALLDQRNKDVSSQIGGLDTLTGARLQGAMKDASDYLASEVGKQLEPATQEALQKAIDRAAAYMKASETLDLIKADPTAYGDSRDRAVAPRSDYDPAKDATDLANQRAFTASRQQQASTLLEAQHAQGLIREADYLQRRRDLDEAAAVQRLLDADQDNKDHAVSLAAYTAEMLGIQTKYQTDKKTLDEKDRASELAAANTHATNMLALERSSAAAALEFQHSQGRISDRAYIDAQEGQARQVALDKYLAAFNTAGSDMVLAWEQYQADLTATTNKGVTDRIALDKQELDTFVQGLQQIGSTFEQLDGSAGLFGKTLSSIGSGIQLFQKGSDLVKSTEKAFGSGGSILDKLGAVGGWLGIAAEAINLIGGIGDAILNLSPGFQAWKKNLLEVADAEKKAIGGAGTSGIKSPWQDALEKDAASREKLANAGFWQRAAWALFGGAPEVMKTEAAKLQSALQTIFNGLADGISSGFTSSMTDAFTKGDMSDWATNFDKTFDQTVGKVILNTLITAALETGAVANDLADLTQAIKAQDYAAIPAILARVKSDAHSALSPIASLAPSLPGYGSDSTTGITSVGTYGATQSGSSSVQFGMPSTQVTISDASWASFQAAFTPPIVAFGGHIDRFGGFVTRLEALERGSYGPPSKSPQGALL